MGQGLDGLKAFVSLEATSKNHGIVREWKLASSTSSPQFGALRDSSGIANPSPRPSPQRVPTLQKIAQEPEGLNLGFL